MSRFRAVRHRAAWAAAGLAILGIPTLTGAAEPTAQEQLFVYEVNRARSDPPGWAVEMGIDATIGGDGLPTDLIGVVPQPPLAINELLVDSSRLHAEEMAANDYFGHQSQVTGKWPNLLAREAGYPLPMTIPLSGGFFVPVPDDSNQIESIAAGFGPGSFDLSNAVNAVIGLIVDTGTPSLGHRIHLLAMTEFNRTFREAGAGYGFDQAATYRNYWAFHTGVENTSDTFLTGVVFSDANQNSLYDAGEGLGGVTVTVGGDMAATNSAGGWSLPINAGTHQVSCSGGAFSGTSQVDVTVMGANRDGDCISGMPGAYVDFMLVPEPSLPAAALAALVALASLSRARALRST
jgi:hypothetical protein